MPEPAKAILLVCINEHPDARELLVTGAKIALENNLRLNALYVEEPHYYYQMNTEKREFILKCLTRAEEMGADILRLQASNVEQAIDSYVRNSLNTMHPVAHVVIGAPEKSTWKKWLTGRRHQAIAEALTQKCGLTVVPLKGDYEGRNFFSVANFERVEPKELFYSLIAVCTALLVAHAMKLMLPDYVFLLQPQNIALIFLIAVVFVGGRWGLVPALSAAIFSHFMVNYFYIRPYFQFDLNQATNLINLVLFLVAAAMIALFSSHTRAYANAAVKREKRTLALYQLQRLTADKKSQQSALKTMHDALRNLFEMEVAFFGGRKQDTDTPHTEYPADVALNEESTQALKACWKNGVTTGVGSVFSVGTEWRFEPMFSSQGIIGVLGVRVPSLLNIDSSFGRLLTAVADQCAAIIQRIGLVHRMEAAKIGEEKEKLRSLLLSSVSHDLKTPLSSIIAALRIYHGMQDRLSDEHKQALITTALEEAQRLDSFISNILDMTRLESGHIKFKMEWQDPVDLAKRVCKRMRPKFHGRELALIAPKEKMNVYVDTIMTEQLLQNLIDNAIKYSPATTQIEIKIEIKDEHFLLKIRDHGKGIPEAMLERVFNKYERLQKEDSQVAGTGLGLAICKSIVDHMHGKIWVINHPEGGAQFQVEFPDIRLGHEAV